MKNKKIIIVVLILVVIIIIGIWYYNKNKKQNIETSNREVKCVVDCKEDEVCIKGACVKKKINYYE